MGNVCCEEEPPRQPHNIRSVNNQHSQQSKKTGKSQKELRFEQQKTLLLDFSTAITYLGRNGREGSTIQYKKFVVGNLMASDCVGEYFRGSLVDEEQFERQCVIKKIDKRKFLSKNQKKSLAIEYELTRYLTHPFIVKCLHFYQDQNFLYLYFDLQNYRHLNQYTTVGVNQELYGRFRTNLENNIRFLVAGVILGLQMLHSLQIVYRGISNQNIVFLGDGYPMLTNLSRLHPQGYTCSQQAEVNHFTSLEEYRAQALTSATDLWDLGVLIYFICKGKYINFTTFKQREFKGEDLSVDLIDMVNHLLLLNPSQRLGAKNINELKNHSFFKNFDWSAYAQKQIVSPFRETDMLYTNYQKNEQTKQSDFLYNNNDGYGMMGMMLFMDLATIYMLSQAFESQELMPENVRHESEQDLNQEDDYQLATQIDIGGFEGFGSGGGDYD